MHWRFRVFAEKQNEKLEGLRIECPKPVAESDFFDEIKLLTNVGL